MVDVIVQVMVVLRGGLGIILPGVGASHHADFGVWARDGRSVHRSGEMGRDQHDQAEQQAQSARTHGGR
ncbi:hypothetical protein [Streptomyces bluensis]|uniref:hypothetical protein n=1 Tax=Streptomyces bluensis TaxID=33897 RepID=UPI003327B45C